MLFQACSTVVVRFFLFSDFFFLFCCLSPTAWLVAYQYVDWSSRRHSVFRISHWVPMLTSFVFWCSLLCASGLFSSFPSVSSPFSRPPVTFRQPFQTFFCHFTFLFCPISYAKQIGEYAIPIAENLYMGASSLHLERCVALDYFFSNMGIFSPPQVFSKCFSSALKQFPVSRFFLRFSH